MAVEKLQTIAKRDRTTANRNGKNQQLKKSVCWIEETQTCSRHTEKGPAENGGGTESRIFSRTGGFIFSKGSSFPNLALLSLKKVRMADWLKCHTECPDQALNLVTPPSRGLLVGEKKSP